MCFSVVEPQRKTNKTSSEIEANFLEKRFQNFQVCKVENIANIFVSFSALLVAVSEHFNYRALRAVNCTSSKQFLSTITRVIVKVVKEEKFVFDNVFAWLFT